MTWLKVCALNEFDVAHKQIFDWDGLEILLIKNKRGIFALENICSHEDAPLHEGCLNGNEITCPLHAWCFNIETGSCATSPDFDLPTFPTKVKDGEVWIRVQSTV